MDQQESFAQKSVNLEGRQFLLRTVGFENGFFVSVSEGVDRMGSMVASLATGPSPVTTTVIPSKSESLFLRLVAERISTRMRGMAIVSGFVKSELKPEAAKALMSEIVEMTEA